MSMREQYLALSKSELNVFLAKLREFSYQRVLQLTPSLVLFSIGDFDETCHAQRQFRDFSNFFVRVEFVNEEHQTDFFLNQQGKSKLWVYYHYLCHGIEICQSLKYNFLAYSNSALKQKQFWFLAEPIECEQIIKSFGDFSQENKILKRWARVGQCFSTSKYGFELKKEDIEVIEDIDRNGYCFTDGLGYISENLALKMAGLFSLTKASAF